MITTTFTMPTTLTGPSVSFSANCEISLHVLLIAQKLTFYKRNVISLKINAYVWLGVVSMTYNSDKVDSL